MVEVLKVVNIYVLNICQINEQFHTIHKPSCIVSTLWHADIFFKYTWIFMFFSHYPARRNSLMSLFPFYRVLHFYICSLLTIFTTLCFCLIARLSLLFNYTCIRLSVSPCIEIRLLHSQFNNCLSCFLSLKCQRKVTRILLTECICWSAF